MARSKKKQEATKKEQGKPGRPPQFETPEEIEQAIEEYFDSCVPQYDEAGNILKLNYPTITGLALALGFESRQSFYDYEKRERFSYVIKKARLRVESHYEEGLNIKTRATGSIFALKNMGWRDNFGLTDGGGGPVKFQMVLDPQAVAEAQQGDE